MYIESTKNLLKAPVRESKKHFPTIGVICAEFPHKTEVKGGNSHEFLGTKKSSRHTQRERINERESEFRGAQQRVRKGNYFGRILKAGTLT